MMKPNLIVFVVMCTFFMVSCSLFKNAGDNIRNSKNTLDNVNSKNGKDSSGIKKPKPYNEVITEKAVSDSGLFIVHKLEEKYFFEIPKKLIDQDILIVSRVSRAASNSRKNYVGDEVNETIIHFSNGPNNKLFIRKYWNSDRSGDTTENGMYRAVMNNNLQPIIAAFDIRAFGIDSSIVVDVTDWLNSDNSTLYFDYRSKASGNLGGFQKDKSFVKSIQSFPLNVELQSVNTYLIGQEAATVEINASIVLLPKEPMRPRYFDERVGYFWTSYIDFDASQGAKPTFLVTRWRLEPRPEDVQKYLNGELVEPLKPIIFYIDPATPKKWVSYLIKGVNDWQKAFEKAGFKNAIYALEAPGNMSEWSLFDARHNAIVYKASLIANASGPHIHDPRSGEILETHINWYHNVLQLLRDWYMIQAGPNDPRARQMVFDDELMGELIRFVICHEVGHTLGLAHNFGASSGFPTDSLRSKTFLESNGICPSIMDYARFNYVAQVKDSLPTKLLLPQIGPYDKWAIEWGYRWHPELGNLDEITYMDEWVTKCLANDRRLFFGRQDNFAVSDPRCQSEDLGDDAIKSGKYGIENLKIVMANLMDWTKEKNANYSSLERMYNGVIDQYSRYIAHVINNIGLNTWDPIRWSQPDSALGFVSKRKQKQAVKFLQDEVFTTPKWILNNEITYRIGGLSINLPAKIQNATLHFLLNGFGIHYYKYSVMTILSNLVSDNEKYSFNEFLNDVEDGIIKEIKQKEPVDFFRRRLQKSYAENLIEMYDFRLSDDPAVALAIRTDFFSIVQTHITEFISHIDKALLVVKDNDTRSHLSILKMQLSESLDRKKNGPSNQSNLLNPTPAPAFTDALRFLQFYNPPFNTNRTDSQKFHINCWDSSNPLDNMR